MHAFSPSCKNVQKRAENRRNLQKLNYFLPINSLHAVIVYNYSITENTLKRTLRHDSHDSRIRPRPLFPPPED